MAFIHVHCRLKRNPNQRFKLSDVQLDATVASLRSIIADQLKTDCSVMDLLYAGRRLDDSVLLSAYEIKNGITVHVIDRVIASETKGTTSSTPSVQEVLSNLKTALRNPNYKMTVQKLVNKAESLQNLFTAAPGLEKDYVALSLLQEPDLLAVLVEQRLVEKLLTKHPSLCQAIKFVGIAVAEKTSDIPSQSQRMRYSLDQMSDDEDMETGQPALPITTGQLGAALASLAGRMGESSSSTNSDGASARSGQQPLTTDIFRQAIAAASSQSPPNPVSESDLQQLHEMGITDENVARRALEASGGNIQAALELIFGDGL